MIATCKDCGRSTRACREVGNRPLADTQVCFHWKARADMSPLRIILAQTEVERKLNDLYVNIREIKRKLGLE